MPETNALHVIRNRNGFARLLIGAALLVVTVACDRSIKVRLIQPVARGMEESFTESGRTRLTRIYPISMPIDGRVGPIDWEPGDRVTSGQILIDFDRRPLELAVQEARAAVRNLEGQLVVQDSRTLEETILEETELVVRMVAETLKAYDATVEAEEKRMIRSAKELARIETLTKSNAASVKELDDARLEAETAEIEWRRSQIDRSAMKIMAVISELGPRAVRQYIDRKTLNRVPLAHSLEEAQARLRSAEYRLGLATIVAPVDGVILEKFEPGGAPYAVGAPLLTMGRLDDLEVVVDVLSQDALTLNIGDAVALEVGERTVSASVCRVEPAGFTKRSSLGVEQQRVNVIVTLPKSGREGLGVGYRVRARFITARNPQALVVPRYSVLQSPDQTWYVMQARDGAIFRKPVQVGLKNDLDLEIVQGLTANDRIVAVPTTNMTDGQGIRISDSN